MKHNMLLRRVGSMVLIRQGVENATNEEWDEFLKFLAKHREELPTIKILVRTDGGVATAPQRKLLAETLGQTHVLVAVVSDHMLVRFAGATIALFQRKYRQFSTKEIGDAYGHLGLTMQEQKLAEVAIKELETILYPSQK